MKRRSFLRLLTSVLGLGALGTFAYPLFRFLLPIGAEAKAKSISLAKRDLPVDTTKDLMIGTTPSIVINSRDKGYVAFSRVCTHLGCLVKYDKAKSQFICPCHAGVFDLEGNVVSGPPPKPLRKLAVRVEGDNLVIG
jgi:cytochrome b6-f complex iron-sulfur subunit